MSERGTQTRGTVQQEESGSLKMTTGTLGSGGGPGSAGKLTVEHHGPLVADSK